MEHSEHRAGLPGASRAVSSVGPAERPADTTVHDIARDDRGRELGSIVGGVFGLVFVIVNSGDLRAVGRVVLLVAAGAALLTVLALCARSLRRRRLHPVRPRKFRRSPFGRDYWMVVVVEAVALFAGARLLTAIGHPELGVAWVSVVVGTHFFALARAFELRRFHLLAVLITLCGVAGFVLEVVDAADAIPYVSGVVSGFVLLGFAVWAMLAEPRT